MCILYYAVRFDLSSSYALADVRFMDDQQGWMSNNAAHHACQGITDRLRADFSEYEHDARLSSFIQELEASATDKRATGEWAQA
ncbi:hypothetical protein EBB07_18330 [Paenibacillaceae bacterium]|nr:hypothetical protein EBB07_18330 [Paenibacillaceae bacterium]